MVVAVLQRGRTQVDHGVVPTELDLNGGSQGGPELRQRPRPVREPVNGSTITQDDGWIVAVSRGFQFALNMENRPLCRTSTNLVILPWESTTEDHTGGFW